MVLCIKKPARLKTHMDVFLSHLIGGTVDSSVVLALAIILCVLFLEDLTIVIVGVLAADGTVSIPLALISLYTGMMIGDTALYALGSFARTHPRLAHYIDHDFTAPFRSWLEHKYAVKVFSGHFIPGLRFTTFAASGFFHLPFRTYLPMAFTGGLLVGVGLFSVSYWFGSITSGWVGHVRWGIAGAFLIALFFIGRHNLLAYRAKKEELEASNRGE